MRGMGLTRTGLVLVALAGSAIADDEPPWAKGVSEADQSSASAEFEVGNTAFTSKRYTEALAAYERALRLWENPAIEFNAARCLIYLDRVLEAYDHLTRSLAYGDAPFDPGVYDEAILNQKLLRAQLSEVTVEVSEPNATVTIDGNAIVPGEPRLLMLGAHQVVVGKDGFSTVTRRVELAAGTNPHLTFRLERPGIGVVTRRWAPWMPWTVLGAGTAMTGVAILFHVESLHNYDVYNDRFRAACPSGCPSALIPDGVASIRRRAELERAVSVSSYVLGGAAIVTGITLVVLNREHIVERMPVVAATGDSVGLALAGTF
jgi:hypothetical protein